MDVVEMDPTQGSATPPPPAPKPNRRGRAILVVGSLVLILALGVLAVQPWMAMAPPVQPSAPTPVPQAGGGESSAITSSESDVSRPSASSPPAAEYTVQEGDTLADIAIAYGTSVDELEAANGLDDADFLQIGQVLKLPAGAVAVERDEPEIAAAEVDTETTADVDTETYTVAPGDSILSIADQYGVDPDALAAANNIDDPDLIVEGDVLHIPTE